MKIQTLKLENVRNYEHLDFKFPEENMVIFHGENAQGKTNILESIFMLALTKSFSPAKNEEIVQWKKEFARISGTISENDDSRELEVFWGKEKKYPKTLKINRVKKKTEEYMGKLRVILFTPQEIDLIPGSPAIRRRHLSIILSQTDKNYLKNITAFQKTLKNRNSLLRMIREEKSNEDELNYWDEKLVLEGSYVYEKRRDFMKKINAMLSESYSHIAGKKHEFALSWTKDISENGEEIEDWYRKKIFLNRQRDIAAETTLSGPHRDDYHFLLDRNELTSTGSRGEWRTAVLATKLSEVKFINEETQSSPILLLDDVLSEFDTTRQKNVLKLFHADQIIITSTGTSQTDHNAKIYNVKNGTVTPE